MTEPANACGPARLEELAAVTKEYAMYSRTSLGIPAAAAGAWLLASALVDSTGSRGWAQIGYLLAPVVWLLVGARTRTYYQRHGVVMAPDEEIAGLGKARGVFAGVACAYLLFHAAVLATYGWGWARSGGPARWAGYFVGVVGLLIGARVAPRWTRGNKDAFGILGLTMVASTPLISDSLRGELVPWLASVRAVAIAILGAMCFGAGLRQHHKYRALERRLGALGEGRA
jgi:hypothetical protein